MCSSRALTGAPVTDVPGSSPRSLAIVVGPVLVIVDPARTEKLASEPRVTGAAAA